MTRDERRLKELVEALQSSLAEQRKIRAVLESLVRLLCRDEPRENTEDFETEGAASGRESEHERPIARLRTETEFPHALVEEYRANQREDAGRQQWNLGIQVVLCVATIATFVAVAVYARITNAQKTIMARQLELSRNQQAPWVGLEQSSMIPVASPQYAWTPALAYPSIWITLRYSVKNYGTSPAFHENESLKITPVRDIGGYMVVDPEKIKNLGRLWIDFCIAYQDSYAQWHHSKYRFISGPPEGQPVIFQDHPGWSYLPFTGASLVAASAN
jgi:hypothetical protein